MLMVVQGIQYGIGYTAHADLHSRSVGYLGGDILSYATLDIVGHDRRQLHQRLVAAHQCCDLRDVDDRIAERPRHVTVDLRYDRLRALYGRHGQVGRYAV